MKLSKKGEELYVEEGVFGSASLFLYLQIYRQTNISTITPEQTLES